MKLIEIENLQSKLNHAISQNNHNDVEEILRKLNAVNFYSENKLILSLTNNSSQNELLCFSITVHFGINEKKFEIISSETFKNASLEIKKALIKGVIINNNNKFEISSTLLNIKFSLKYSKISNDEKSEYQKIFQYIQSLRTDLEKCTDFETYPSLESFLCNNAYYKLFQYPKDNTNKIISKIESKIDKLEKNNNEFISIIRENFNNYKDIRKKAYMPKIKTLFIIGSVLLFGVILLLCYYITKTILEKPSLSFIFPFLDGLAICIACTYAVAIIKINNIINNKEDKEFTKQINQARNDCIESLFITKENQPINITSCTPISLNNSKLYNQNP